MIFLDVENKIVEDYWIHKLKSETTYRLTDSKEYLSQSISIPRTQASYFYKLTGHRLLPEFTLFTSLYTLLLQRYFSSFKGFILSESIPTKEGDIIEKKPLIFLRALENSITFKAYIEKIKNEVKEVIGHQNYDSYKIQKRLGDNCFSKVTPFGMVLNTNTQKLNVAFWLDISTDRTKGIQIKLTWAKGFVEDYFAQSFLDSFKNLIGSLENYIDVPLAKINILSSKAYHLITQKFNNTYLEYPKDKSMVDLFEAQVEKTPHAIAVVYKEKAYTYAHLNKKVNQFAHYLTTELTISKGAIVGVFQSKSDTALISILAILKSGAVFLPIDPKYPDDRVRYIIEDSQLQFLLCDFETINTVDYENKVEVTQLQLEHYAVTNPKVSISPDDLAYIIYTSGSTGKPKGVMIAHKSNVNMSLDQIRIFEVTPTDKVVWFASIAFDASISEIMMALYSGAGLTIPEENTIKDKNRFVGFLNKTASTVVTFPPSYLDLISKNDLQSLRCIITAGEPAHVQKAAEMAQDIDYYNAYGPTECAVCVSTYKVHPLDACKKSIPIGKPIANLKTYILDDFLNPVPIGVEGKLHVSGIGVGRGYLNKMELTQEKFIAHPFQRGETLYDTGDLCKWLPDGNIEFVGRKDEQVKLRGHRIELGEIENTILQSPQAIQQVVVLVKRVNHEKAIVAYIVGKNIEKEALRHTISLHLPAYMIPAYFVEIPEIPLTPNGKVDKNKLPEVIQSDLIQETYEPPTNKIEYLLVDMWQRVLNIEKIGIADNFFSLGGHSLQVLKISNEISRKLQCQLEYTDIFKYPTIKEIAQIIQGNRHENEKAIIKISKCNLYEVSPSQQRLWIASQLGGNKALQLPITFKIAGNFEVDLFKKASEFLIRKYDVLRSGFKLDPNGLVKQFILNFEEVTKAFFYFDTVTRNINSAVDYIAAFIDQDIDLEKPPLLQIVVVKLENEGYGVLIQIHHLITDGWSMELFFKELFENYETLVQGQLINTQPLKIQYQDYAYWLNGRQSEINTKEQQFWQQIFQKKIPQLQLPFERKTRPKKRTYNGTYINEKLSIACSQKLKVFCEAHSLTKFSVLMSTFKMLLYKYTDHTDLTVGTPVSGRINYQLEDQLGLFVNSLPIRSTLDPQKLIVDLLQNENKLMIDYYNNQLYQMDTLISELSIETPPGRTPLFDYMLIFQNQSTLFNSGEIIQKRNITLWEDFKMNKVQNDLSLVFSEGTASQISFQVFYNTDIFEPQHISDWVEDYKYLLEACLDRPDQKLETLLANKVHKFITDKPIEFLMNAPTTVRYNQETFVEEKVEEHLEIKLKLQEILRIFTKEPISFMSDFFEIGGSSLGAIQVVSEINEVFNSNYTIPDFYENASVNRFHDFMVKEAQSSPNGINNEVITHLNYSGSDKSTLICFPPIVGESLIYKQLATQLKENYNSYGVNIPIVSESEVSKSNIVSLITEQIIPFLKKDQVNYLLGYSIGVNFVYEIVQRLTQFSFEIILIDRGPKLNIPSKITKRLTKKVIEQETPLIEKATDLGLDKERIQTRIGQTLQIFSSLDPQQLNVLEVPIHAFEAKDKEHYFMESWKTFTTKKCTVSYLNGNHFNCLDYDNSKTLASYINQLA